MKETSKSYVRRLTEGHFDRYLIGNGIDIGAGDDPLRPLKGDLRAWDKEDGDAILLNGISDESYDYVYSSHCLEHIIDVFVALRNWIRVLKPGGWLYLVVPDYCLYEKFNWPSRYNQDHKSSFSLDLPRSKVRRPNHFHVADDIIPYLNQFGMRIEIIRLEDDGFDYENGVQDQTLGDALAQICLVARKNGVPLARSTESPQQVTANRLESTGVFTHAGDIGDIIYSLPTMRGMGGGSLLLHPTNGTRQRMTRETAEMLRPLLEAQPYVKKVNYSESPSGFALDSWRRFTFPTIYNLADRQLDMASLPHTEREIPWISVEPINVSRVAIHRSKRYCNPLFPWKRVLQQFAGQLVFVGLHDEHEVFEREFGSVEYRPTANFLELAQIIAGAELFIGNQSAPLSLAVAMCKPFVVEQSVEPWNWNCHFQRSNAVYVLRGDEPLPMLEAELHC